jgi:CheY-like chemotaxis protein
MTQVLDAISTTIPTLRGSGFSSAPGGSRPIQRRSNPRSAADRAPRRPEEPASRRILLIEDDEDSREALRDLLELEGYEVETAGDGLEGLEAFAAQEPCLVLLDLMMPKMDGWEFLEALREYPPSEAPVVILSAFGGDRSDRRIADRPFLAKPVDIEELLGTVGRYCA